jgi:pyruvate dehydrogenase E1 component alpha subunit
VTTADNASWGSETVARFEIHRTRCIDAEGRAVASLPAFARDPAELTRLYRAMLLTRAFDAKAVTLQRTGRLGTYASSLGQEAVAIGVASAMRATDVLVPSFREHGAQLWRGVRLVELFLLWGGDERGHDYAIPREDFPISIPVASHAPHAAGAALAFKLRGEERAAVCVVGDGATSKGDFYEALNVAGAWRLPVVFVIANNQWAISVPRAAQTAAETLAQKAIAAGIAGEQVDGNDVVAVRLVLERALERARLGTPGVVECMTYRLGDHTTSDDATRYRDDESLRRAWATEPVGRLRRYLTSIGRWSDADEAAARAEYNDEVEAAAAEYLATPPQPLSSMFDHTYAHLPADLEAQRAELRETVGDA